MKVVSLLSALTALCLPFLSFGEEGKADFNDGVNRDDPKFVTASLLVISPGNELFSCAGHAAFRLQCPTFKLDYCFSYESERAVDRLPSFFAGKLKMGMFAIPTKEFLEEYSRDGRGVRQYRMNLPPKVKQRLWKLMDDKVAEGVNLPYDYIKRGCAWSMLRCLLEAIAPDVIEEGPWPEKYKEYHRAVIASSLDDYPWTRCIIHAIVGTDPDRDVPNIRKLVIPKDCLDYLKTAKIKGIPIIDAGDGEELLPCVTPYHPPIVSPMTVAVLVLLMACVNAFLRFRWLVWLLAAVQFLAGCFFCYMIGFSGLPATSWNWLVVPFNPLMPVVLGVLLWTRWSPPRQEKWIAALGWSCVLILLGWIAFMVFSPHMRTDPAYIVLAAALAVVYVALISGDGLYRIMRCRNNSDAV